MRRKAHVPFGKGLTEKDPNHGHLAGGLLHSVGGRRKRVRTRGYLAGGLPCGDTPGVVDQVMVPRGAGALVRATTASGGDGALTLVTDSGQRFAVPTPDAATRLRYDPAVARSVPAPFVRLLPAGPALDPEAAAREFTGR